MWIRLIGNMMRIWEFHNFCNSNFVIAKYKKRSNLSSQLLSLCLYRPVFDIKIIRGTTATEVDDIKAIHWIFHMGDITEKFWWLPPSSVHSGRRGRISFWQNYSWISSTAVKLKYLQFVTIVGIVEIDSICGHSWFSSYKKFCCKFNRTKTKLIAVSYFISKLRVCWTFLFSEVFLAYCIATGMLSIPWHRDISKW